MQKKENKKIKEGLREREKRDLGGGEVEREAKENLEETRNRKI